MKKNLLLLLFTLIIFTSCSDDKVDNPMANTKWTEELGVESFEFSDELVSIVTNGKTVYILSYQYDNGKILAKGGKNYNDKEIYFTAELKSGEKYGTAAFVGKEYLVIIENGLSSTVITKNKYYKK